MMEQLFAENEDDVGGFSFVDTEKAEESFSFADTMKEDDDETTDFEEVSGETEKVVIKGKLQNYVFDMAPGARRGGGKQASIYFCKGTNDNEEYAVKLYNPNAVNRNKLSQILNFLENNKHPNVTNVIEYGTCNVQDRDCYYAVMEIYDCLDRTIYKWKRLDSETYRESLVAFVEDVNEALRFIHRNGFYHGDLKPDNIMVSRKSKRAVLIDFGGAAKAKRYGESEKAAAATASYAPPETLRNGQKISKYTDYYLVGVSVAELIDGTYPGNVKEIEAEFGTTSSIHLYRLPADLPDYYETLLRGLLYENDNDEERKKHRWINDKIETWLEHMKNGQLKEAAQRNKVSIGTVAAVDKVETQWDFGKSLTMELGEDEISYTFTNLTQMADTFLELWDEGLEQLLDDEIFTDSVIKADILKLIRNGINKLQNVDVRNGHSVNAEYFKFLYKYASDKEKFRWKNLPNVENMEQFALTLLSRLDEMQENESNFGEWWKNMSDDIVSTSTSFAEIFRNKVFSFYLSRAYPQEKEIYEQCKKVENIFQTLKPEYTNEEMMEMYILVKMILNDTEYEIPTGKIYRTYEEFLQDVETKAYDPKSVYQMEEIIKGVKGRNGFYPSFLAWQKMQRG